jgi:hypothetical protein
MAMIKSNREIWGLEFPLGGQPRAVTGAMGCRFYGSAHTR